MTVARWIGLIWQSVFPYVPQCVCCGVEKDVSSHICPACAEKLDAIKMERSQPGAMRALSAYQYAAPAAAIIKGFKYGDKKWLVAFMGTAICEAVFGPGWKLHSGVSICRDTQSKVNTGIEKESKEENTTAAGTGYGPYAVTDFDWICHVPLHKKRRAARGFDQARELAMYMAGVTGIPFFAALKRIRNTPTQTRLNEKERKENVRGAFEKTMDISGRVLLIDDVLTTGATAEECAAVLKAAGAKSVCIATFASAGLGTETP